jgi:LuxR family maltose regulon positive regulatory protein
VATLLPTKFYVPPLPASFVARPRLLERLDNALCHRLTLVSAPAGAGKTTLVSAWIQSIRKKGAAIGWLSLDEADNDPSIFLDYVIACLEEGGISVERVEMAPGVGGPARIERWIADLIRDIMPLKRDVVLILDDYQSIQNTAVHGALRYLVDHAPARLHLVILTRADPPLELARLRVSGQLVEFRMENLRFSAEEAMELLSKRSGVSLTEADVAILNERTEGWIAGLQMAAISLEGHEDPSTFVAAFAGSHRFVFDYLLEQVLDRQPPEWREFLLKTSVLERFSAPLCEAVAETGGAARGLLDALEHANLFLTPLDDERGWYRYHHLLSDLLKLTLEQVHPGLSAVLHRRACLWFEEQGMLPESLQHALAARDMELVAHIVSANVLLVVENDEAATMLQQLDSVPTQELIAWPWLGIARAWALGAAQVEKSHQVLDGVEKSVEKLPEGDECRRLRGHLAAARAYVYSVEGNRAETIANASLADELLPPDEVAVRALSLTISADIRMDDRKHDPTAMPTLQRALALAMQAHKPHVAMMAAAATASANLHLGRFHEMERVCREALQIADSYERRYQRPLSATAGLCALLSRVMAEWGNNEEAIRLARRGLMLSERWGQLDTEVMCLNYLGRALALGNDWEQARRVCERADAAAQKISPWFYKMSVTFDLNTLLDSELPDRQEIAARWQLVEESGAPHIELPRARLMLLENRNEEALELLDEALAHLDGQPSFDTPWIYALKGLAYQARGDERRALAALKQALELGEVENRLATFVEEGPAMERLLRIARAKGLAPGFVERILAAFDARRKRRPQLPPVAEEPLIEPLSARELEVLRQLDGPLSTPEIAEELVVSTNTVRTHIKSIYGKLGVHGRSAAVRRARELSLVA